MFRHILFVARKDLKYMLRAKETLLWVFLMPIVFFYFIGRSPGVLPAAVPGGLSGGHRGRQRRVPG